MQSEKIENPLKFKKKIRRKQGKNKPTLEELKTSQVGSKPLKPKLFLGSLALEEFTDCCLPLSWVLGCQRKRGSRVHQSNQSNQQILHRYYRR